MKKKLFLLLILLFPINVLAASGTIKATGSSSVTLNNTFTVTVTCSSTEIIGSCDFDLDYDKSKLSIQSGQEDLSVRDFSKNGKDKSMSYKYKFKAIKTGTAYINIDNGKVGDWETVSYISTSVSNLKVTIKEAVVVNYSSDNNLKSLSVDGFELIPEFNKSTLEYSITALPTTTNIKINATANDASAKVSGTGEKEVIEGNNSFGIVVTAENGTSKTYTINVTVPEKDPVKISFNDEEYNALRKLPEDIPTNFTTSSININNEEIPCLQNSLLNITLIYLRDKNNKEAFYIYNESKNTITLYNEITNNDFIIYVETIPKEFKEMIKTTITINDQSIEAYQIQKNSKDYIIYGRNTSTGKSNYYVYDKDNRTISIFNEKDYEYLKESNGIYIMITYILGILLAILLIIIIMLTSNQKKFKKMQKELLSKKKKSFN